MACRASYVIDLLSEAECATIIDALDIFGANGAPQLVRLSSSYLSLREITCHREARLPIEKA